MPLLCVWVYLWGLEVHNCCRPQEQCRRQTVGCMWAFHQWRWMCGGHGKFPAWSPPGTSWTGWVRVSIPDGHLLLSCRTPLADCSWGLPCWSYVVPEWLELVLHLCWSFWGPATGLHASLFQAPSWRLCSYGTNRAGVVGITHGRMEYVLYMDE